MGREQEQESGTGMVICTKSCTGRDDSELTVISFTGTTTLQKQIGCFNHRVVTMAADMLKRQW